MVSSFKIKEVKEVILFIKEELSIDFTQYAYVSLKIKFEQFCDKYKLEGPYDLIERLGKNLAFRKDFLLFIHLNEFELFRDPALWRSIKEDILRNINTAFKFKVLFPSCYEGGELLSFLILREELGLTDKIEVIYTSKLSFLNQVKEGFVHEERKHLLNLSNYKRIGGNELSDEYFELQINRLIPSDHLFVNTKHIEYSELDGDYSKRVNLIIYRNKLLNFNKNLQVEVVDNLIRSLKTGGFLVLGVKEKLVNEANRELFTVFNLRESVYKKKN